MEKNLMESLNLNIDSQNLEQCLKEIWNFGGTTFQNICTGRSNYVQWGNLDWVGMIILLTFCISCVGFLIGLFIAVIKIAFDY